MPASAQDSGRDSGRVSGKEALIVLPPKSRHQALHCYDDERVALLRLQRWDTVSCARVLIK